MKITLSRYEIASRLTEDPYASWSYEGALALAQFIEMREEETGEEEEFERCNIRCEFAEFDQEELVNNYAHYDDFEELLADLGEDATIDIQAEAIYDALQDYTSVLKVSNGHYIVQSF